MSFGKWSGAGGRVMTAALLGFATTLLIGTMGCSGGGGGVSNPGATPTPGQAQGSTATLTGTVVDTENNQAVDPNAVVAFGSYYTVTGTNGTFSLTIPSGTAGNLIVYGRAQYVNNVLQISSTTGLPASDNYYENTGFYPGTTTSTSSQVALLTTGIPITAQAAGATDALGYIGLLTLNDPPPPPNI